MNTNSLEISHLYKTFHGTVGEITALQDINLNIRKGEFVSIIGTSGCGKSTLLRIISGLESPTSGEVRSNGVTVTGPGPDRGMAFQESRLFPWLTLEKNILFGISYERKKSLSKAEQLELAEKYLELVGLKDFGKAYPNQLSGGMQQRASIARALIESPQILLLDEPFGALDAMTRINMQDEIQRIWQEEKLTMVLVTHDIEEAIYLGDRVIVFSARPGKVRREMDIDLPRPRLRNSAEFVAIKRSLTAEFFKEKDLLIDYVI